MEVILSKDIEKIGKAGMVVKVKDGFARNFLIPNKLALPLNSVNLKKLEQERAKAAIEQEKNRKSAEAIKQKLESLSFTMPVLTNEEDKLYGSIGPAEISAALKDEGIEVNKNSIVVHETIKSLGIYEVTVNLHPQVAAKLKIWIVKK
jgi:large subunit ribosomal protein L9